MLGLAMLWWKMLGLGQGTETCQNWVEFERFNWVIVWLIVWVGSLVLLGMKGLLGC